MTPKSLRNKSLRNSPTERPAERPSGAHLSTNLPAITPFVPLFRSKAGVGPHTTSLVHYLPSTGGGMGETVERELLIARGPSPRYPRPTTELRNIHQMFAPPSLPAGEPR